MPKGVYDRKKLDFEPVVKSAFMADVPFPDREGWKDFTDRLDFLSPEGQIEASGKMQIIPRKETK